MNDFHIQWHITDRCNLRCLHCYQDSFEGSCELNWENLKEICDNLIKSMQALNKRLTISLTGGEPFLKDELFSIIDYLSASEYVSELNIITNAILVDKYISKLKGFPKLKNIYVSLEGTTPLVNDSIRGNGTFRKVLSNLELLKDNDFSVFIMFTLLKSNLGEVERLLDFCRKNGLSGFILERFIPLGQSKKIKQGLVSSSQLQGVYKIIFEQCGLDFFEEAVKYHALKVEVEEGKADLFGAECVVGRYGCAVLPDGGVLPCRRFNLKIGSLFQASLADIFNNSPVLKKARLKESLQGYCRDCKIEGCLGCRALAFAVSGYYTLSDPLCWIRKAGVT
ncbi:MAG: radical SAM protein [Candidatus Omnitrophica bacterium]|nr:radical SAM protein [Candidatus Omnitrophota bacterium]